MNSLDDHVGVIAAHGCRSSDLSYVILPSSITLHCIGATDTTIDALDVDIDIICDNDTRKLHESAYPHSPSTYPSGAAIKNVDLLFKLVFSTDTFYSTGIITRGSMMQSIGNIPHNISDETLMKMAMKSHDNSIIPMEQLWGSSKHLGQVFRMLETTGKRMDLIGAFCRAARNTDIAPTFMTVTIDETIYHESFIDKLIRIETLPIDEFSLMHTDVIPMSRLKYFVTREYLCRSMRTSIARDNTVSSFMFHSVIEIHRTARLPKECVVNAFCDIFSEILIDLRTMGATAVRASNPKMSASLTKGTRYLIANVFLRENESSMLKSLIENADMIDDVLNFAGKVLSENNIDDELQHHMMSFIYRKGFF